VCVCVCVYVCELGEGSSRSANWRGFPKGSLKEYPFHATVGFSFMGQVLRVMIYRGLVDRRAQGPISNKVEDNGRLPP
jgi:hypothetical protein